MGTSASKNTRNPSEKDVRTLREKIRLLQEEVKQIMSEKEKQGNAHERDAVVFALKEAEWKQERKKLREEARRLRKAAEAAEEEEERIRDLGEEGGDWELRLGSRVLVEQMREERARRDEAVEKWKRLYLAIKAELDQLLQTTHGGDALYWRAEQEDMMEQLKRELKAKEQIIEALRERIASMELEEYKREREVDILRQSLRILSDKKTTQVTKKSSRRLNF